MCPCLFFTTRETAADSSVPTGLMIADRIQLLCIAWQAEAWRGRDDEAVLKRVNTSMTSQWELHYSGAHERRGGDFEEVISSGRFQMESQTLLEKDADNSRNSQTRKRNIPRPDEG